jgi:hypothetical protein
LLVDSIAVEQFRNSKFYYNCLASDLFRTHKVINLTAIVLPSRYYRHVTRQRATPSKAAKRFSNKEAYD